MWASTNADGVVVDIDDHTTYAHPTDSNSLSPYNGLASKCMACHMPFTAKSSYSYDIRSHSFKYLYPAEALNDASLVGRPNGCMTGVCHTVFGQLPTGWPIWDPTVPADLSDGKDGRWVFVDPIGWNNYILSKASTHQTVTEVSFGGGPTVVVTLDGTGSFDPYGDAPTYQWYQVGGPAVTLSDDTVAAPTFTANSIGEYTFRLIVSAQGLDSKAATVAVTVTK